MTDPWYDDGRGRADRGHVEQSRAEQDRMALARAHVEVDILAYRLREARRRLRVSRERVAADLGVDPSWIDALESERVADVPALLLVRYTRLLGGAVEMTLPGEGRR